MKELHRKGVANRPGPESCGARREAGCEALAGVQAGWVWSSEKGIPERRRSPVWRKAVSKQRTESLARDSGRLCGVVDPRHAWTLKGWEPGDPGGARDARNRGPEGEGDER